MRRERRPPRRRARARGFTLLEVIIVVTAIALLAAALAPVAAGALRMERRRETMKRMDALAVAIRNCFADTKRVPATLQSLITDTTPGWRGPYLDPGILDANGVPSYRVDAKGRAFGYRFRPADASHPEGYAPGATAMPWIEKALVVEVIGAGENGVIDTPGNGPVSGDDLIRIVNLTDLDREWRYEETLAKLRTLNAALEAYRRVTGAYPNPPANTLAQLYAGGYVRDTRGGNWYQTDAWGVPFTLSGGNPRSFSSQNVR